MTKIKKVGRPSKKDSKPIEPIEPVETVEKNINQPEPIHDNSILLEKLTEVVNDETQNSIIEEKKKRGRKSNAEKLAEMQEQQKQNQINFPIDVFVDMLIKRMPNPIPLSDSEKIMINDSGNVIVNKYGSNFKYWEETQFAGTMLAVFYSRYTTPQLQKDIDTLKNNEETKNG